MGKEIGIDFGTTNTVISYYNKKGRLRQLKYENSMMIPSVIYYKSKSEFIVGKEAKKKADYKKNSASVANFKPKIGSTERQEIITEAGEKILRSYRDIAADFLNRVINGVEDKLIHEFGPVEGVLEKAVVTVPAKFNDKERQAVRRAVQNAGIAKVKLVAEPTAAAIGYQDDCQEFIPGAAILVYDFGGGTFDVSVIQEEQGRFKEIARGGRKDLGGNDLTDKVFQKIWQEVNKHFSLDLPLDEDEFDEEESPISFEEYHKNWLELWNAANQLKEELSEEETDMVNVNLYVAPDQSELYTVELTRAELNQLIEPEIDETVQATEQTLEEARQRGVETVDKVVLAGGSSNLPLVYDKVQDALDEQSQEVIYGADTSTLISRGAAVLAKQYQNIDSLTQPITNVDLGVVVTDGVQFQKFEPLILAGTDLPSQASRTFHLLRDGQQRLEINYYERDRKINPQASRAGDAGIELVDTLIIDSLPKGLKKAAVQIEVTFKAQKDGTLNIEAALLDNQGQVIKQGTMTYQKKSDLE